MFLLHRLTTKLVKHCDAYSSDSMNFKRLEDSFYNRLYSFELCDLNLGRLSDFESELEGNLQLCEILMNCYEIVILAWTRDKSKTLDSILVLLSKFDAISCLIHEKAPKYGKPN